MRASPNIKVQARKLLLLAAIICLAIFIVYHLNHKPIPPSQAGPVVPESAQLTVLDYGYNQVGDIDKILVDHSGKLCWLHFPPHAAQMVLQNAPKNTLVDAVFRGGNKTFSDNKPLYELVNLQSGNRLIVIKDIAAPAPVPGKMISFKGKIKKYQFDDQGAITGFIVDTFMVEIPKHLQHGISTVLPYKDSIIVSGFERKVNGFVNSSGLILLKPNQFIINNTTYLL